MRALEGPDNREGQELLPPGSGTGGNKCAGGDHPPRVHRGVFAERRAREVPGPGEGGLTGG